uniref:Uncharacterized protein n=1 Tax=candidate division WOR-3 bacterium TaxID=2052148 RepID=A0A7C6E9V0_UNCW3
MKKSKSYFPGWVWKGKPFILGGLFILFSLFSFRCLERPRLPSWDTEITIPLLNDSYSIADLLSFSNRFRITDDSVVQFYSEFNIDTITPQHFLNLLAQNCNLNLTIAQFQITSLSIGRLVLSLQEIVGPWLPESTIKTIIPSFTQSLDKFIDLPDIRHLELISGIWKFRIQNFTNLNFDSLTFYNPSFSYLRAIGIGANSTQMLEQRITDQSLENPIPIQIGISSPGSFPDSIYVSGLDSVVIELAIDSLRLSSGVLRLPQTSACNQTTINVNSDKRFRIDSLELADGEARLSFFNTLPTAIWLNLTIPCINYQATFRIEPQGSIIIPVSLVGLKLGCHKDMPLGGSPNEEMTIQVLVNLTSEPTYDFVTIEQDDGLIANYCLSNLKFQRIFGELLEPIYVSSPEKTLISFPGGQNSNIRVADARINLYLVNTIGFPAIVRFKTLARKENGDSISQFTEIAIQPGSCSQPSVKNLVFPITDVVNFGAREIKFSTAIRVFGGGRIEANSFARGNGCLSTPLKVAFACDTVVFGEYRFGLGEKDRKTLTDWQEGKYGIKVIDAQLYTDFSNHFPIGFDAWIVVSNDTDSSSLRSDSGRSLVIPCRVPAGIVDQTKKDKYCTSATDSNFVVGLSEEDISLFTNRALKSRLYLYFFTQDTVTIKPNDYLNFTSRAEIKLRVK